MWSLSPWRAVGKEAGCVRERQRPMGLPPQVPTLGEEAGAWVLPRRAAAMPKAEATCRAVVKGALVAQGRVELGAPSWAEARVPVAAAERQLLPEA